MDKRLNRRETLYPHQMSLAVNSDMDQAIKAAVDATGSSAAEIIRKCVERALPAVSADGSKAHVGPWASIEDIASMKGVSLAPLDNDAMEHGVFLGCIRRQKGDTPTGIIHVGPEHVCSFGPRDSGMTETLVIPTMLIWRGNAIVYDPEGAIWDATRNRRREMGQRAIKIDLRQNSCSNDGFNPLSEVRIGTSHEAPDATFMATIIAESTLAEGRRCFGDERLKGVIEALAAVTLHILQSSPRASLAELNDWLAKPEPAALCDSDSEWVTAQGCAFMEMPAEELDQIMKGAHAAVMRLNDLPGMVTMASGWNLDELGSENASITLYMIPGRHRGCVATATATLFRLIVEMACRKLTTGSTGRDRGSRLLFMMDDAHQLGYMPHYERALPYMAGYGLRSCITFPHVSALHWAYGNEECVLMNHHVRTFAAPDHMTTIDSLTRSIGSDSFGLLDALRLRRLTKDAWGRPAEAGDTIITLAGRKPIKARQAIDFGQWTARA